jgi:hypothetical protein
MHLAVYALSLLGGAHQKIHTEDIAAKCLELAPDRFKWEKYGYPDKELVRKALFHASESKNGALVAGRSGSEQRGKSRDGWQLTPAGAAWVKANEQALVDSRPPLAGQEVIPRRDADRLLKRLRSDSAFRMYIRESTLDHVTSYMFTDFLNTSPDASPDIVRLKFERLLSTAELLGDGEILAFLRACESKFEQLMSTATRRK